jgi:hypothetical protein
MSTPVRRTLRYALLFWLGGLALLALDWRTSRPHDRFAEPPPWAIGQAARHTGAHCAAAPALKK